MVDISTLILYTIRMTNKINTYEVVFKSLDTGRVCVTTIKAKSFVSAKMKFSDQGYGPLVNIIEVSIQEDK